MIRLTNELSTDLRGEIVTAAPIPTKTTGSQSSTTRLSTTRPSSAPDGTRNTNNNDSSIRGQRNSGSERSHLAASGNQNNRVSGHPASSLQQDIRTLVTALRNRGNDINHELDGYRRLIDERQASDNPFPDDILYLLTWEIGEGRELASRYIDLADQFDTSSRSTQSASVESPRPRVRVRFEGDSDRSHSNAEQSSERNSATDSADGESLSSESLNDTQEPPRTRRRVNFSVDSGSDNTQHSSSSDGLILSDDDTHVL